MASERMLNWIMHGERCFAEEKRMRWQCPRSLDEWVLA